MDSKKYRFINPDGGFSESYDLAELPDGWEYEEINISQDLSNLAEVEINQLKETTKYEINELLYEHTERFIIRGIPIPEYITEEYNKKRLDYSEKKNQILTKYNLQ